MVPIVGSSPSWHDGLWPTGQSVSHDSRVNISHKFIAATKNEDASVYCVLADELPELKWSVRKATERLGSSLHGYSGLGFCLYSGLRFNLHSSASSMFRSLLKSYLVKQ